MGDNVSFVNVSLNGDDDTTVPSPLASKTLSHDEESQSSGSCVGSSENSCASVDDLAPESPSSVQGCQTSMPSNEPSPPKQTCNPTTPEEGLVPDLENEHIQPINQFSEYRDNIQAKISNFSLEIVALKQKLMEGPLTDELAADWVEVLHAHAEELSNTFEAKYRDEISFLSTKIGTLEKTFAASAQKALETVQTAVSEADTVAKEAREKIIVARDAQRGAEAAREKAETKERTTAALAASLVTTNNNLHEMVEELQNHALREHSEAEHLSRAAAALVINQTSAMGPCKADSKPAGKMLVRPATPFPRPITPVNRPTSSTSIMSGSTWLGEIWLSAAHVYPQLKSAESSWSQDKPQRALNDLMKLVHISEATPSMTASGSSDDGSNESALSDLALMARLLRAAIQHTAGQSEVALRGAAEVANLAAKRGRMEIERRAQWIRGVSAFEAQMPMIARVCFARCTGAPGHEKVVAAYRALAEARLTQLEAGDEGNDVGEEFLDVVEMSTMTGPE